jgi:hypothetical protein
MFKLLPAVVAVLCLSACATDLSRPPEGELTTAAARSVALHGPAGHEIETLFHAPRVRESMRDSTGANRGFEVVEFHTVEIAPDPLQPTALRLVGYIRKLREDRAELHFHEFHDRHWNRVGLMGPLGDLYRLRGGQAEHLGRHQLEAAARILFPAPGGYGSDLESQYLSRVRMHDPDVASADPRARGLHFRTHSAAPAVVVVTERSTPEVALHAELMARRRVRERDAALAERRLAERYGVIEDGFYGGIEFRNGQPVDERGRVLGPASLR